MELLQSTVKSKSGHTAVSFKRDLIADQTDKQWVPILPVHRSEAKSVSLQTVFWDLLPRWGSYYDLKFTIKLQIVSALICQEIVYENRTHGN